MKKQIIGFILGLSVMGLLAMQETYSIKKSTSEVEQFEGVLVFMDCKPVKEYEYLGTVDLVFSSTEYFARRDGLIKRAKKKYPSGEGIIIQLKPGQADKADVIKFK